MDTTLRDGEQTSGVSFAAHEKLSIAQALLDLGVNRLEIASARVSDGEFEAVKRVASWAERTGNHSEARSARFCGWRCFVELDRSGGLSCGKLAL